MFQVNSLGLSLIFGLMALFGLSFVLEISSQPVENDFGQFFLYALIVV